MKITRDELKGLIAEELRMSKSILLEMPMGATTGSKMGALDPSAGYDTDLDEDNDAKATRQSLWHLGAQAQQLHDMIGDDEKLDPSIHNQITKAAGLVEKVFKDLTHARHNPKGQ